MAIISEDYVSFEIVKLLKEKGFDWNCESKKFYPEPYYDQESPDGVYSPTLQMAMKWLREVFDLIIYVRLVNDGDLCHDAWGFSIYNKFTNESIKGSRLWFKYETACEAAIKYCLENLI